MCVKFSLSFWPFYVSQNPCALDSSCLPCVVYRRPRAVVALPLFGMLDGRRVVWGVRSCHASSSHYCPSVSASPMPGSMSELGPDFPTPSLRRLLTAAFALQFAAKNLLASSAEHLPIIPSRHSSPRTPRPERTNTAQMGGFLHLQCRPGASTHDPLSISAH